MTALDQLSKLAALAKKSEADADKSTATIHFRALGIAYDQAVSILGLDREQSTQTETEPDQGVVAAMTKFCGSHCFHGRKDGKGEASECAICPLAVYTLTGEGDDGDHDADFLRRRREERSATEAKQALNRMHGRGVDTLAADNTLTRNTSPDSEPTETSVGYRVLE